MATVTDLTNLSASPATSVASSTAQAASVDMTSLRIPKQQRAAPFQDLVSGVATIGSPSSPTPQAASVDMTSLRIPKAQKPAPFQDLDAGMSKMTPGGRTSPPGSSPTCDCKNTAPGSSMGHQNITLGIATLATSPAFRPTTAASVSQQSAARSCTPPIDSDQLRATAGKLLADAGQFEFIQKNPGLREILADCESLMRTGKPTPGSKLVASVRQEDVAAYAANLVGVVQSLPKTCPGINGANDLLKGIRLMTKAMSEMSDPPDEE